MGQNRRQSPKNVQQRLPRHLRRNTRDERLLNFGADLIQTQVAQGRQNMHGQMGFR
jgi:hypothetical protein